MAVDVNPLNRASKAVVDQDDGVPNHLPAPLHGMAARLYRQLSWSAACIPQPVVGGIVDTLG